MIGVEFRLCADSKKCSYVSWSKSSVQQGWRTNGKIAFGDVLVPWTDSCSDGRYEANINDHHYKGNCAVTRTESGLCFAMDSTSTEGREAMQLTQCFSIEDATCTMRLEGRFQYLSGFKNSQQSAARRLTAPQTFSCAVSSI